MVTTLQYMKRNIYLLLLSFVVLSILACDNTKNKPEVGGRKIMFVENKSEHDKLELSQNRRYIQLDTQEECLITEITQLLCTSKEIFIFDVYSQSVFVFSYEGKYLRKLHRIGQGPGEYSMMSAISLNEQDHRISIVDLGSRIINYDMDTFECLEQQSIDAVSAEEVAKGEYIAYNSLPVMKKDVKHKFHLLQYDKQGNIEKKYLPIDFESGYSMRPIHRFYRQGNDIFFYPPFTSEVYKITKDSCFVCYNVAYENLSFPPLEYLQSSEMKGENYISKLYNEHYIYSVQLFENKDFFVSLFNVEKKGYIGIYDKNRDKGSYFFRKTYLAPNQEIDYFQIVGSCGDDFIAVLKPFDIKENVKVRDTELGKIINNTKEDSNPILMFFQFRDENFI